MISTKKEKYRSGQGHYFSFPHIYLCRMFVSTGISLYPEKFKATLKLSSIQLHPLLLSPHSCVRERFSVALSCRFFPSENNLHVFDLAEEMHLQISLDRVKSFFPIAEISTKRIIFLWILLHIVLATEEVTEGKSLSGASEKEEEEEEDRREETERERDQR